MTLLPLVAVNMGKGPEGGGVGGGIIFVAEEDKGKIDPFE